MPDNKNNNNDSLERFFRKKADEYEIPYREDDWLKLEKELEIRDVQHTYGNRLRWMAAASILIISMLGYFTYENHNRLNQLGQHLNDVITPGTEQDSENFTPREPNLPATIEEGGSGTEDHSEGIGHRDPPLASFDDRDSPVSGATHERFSPAEDEQMENFFRTSDTRLVVKREIPVVSPVDRPLPDMERSAITAVADDYEPAVSFDQTGPRLTAGFVLAPDLSTVGSLSNFYEPGYKAGVNVEYNLNSRFAITAGIMHSTVRYIAYSGDHNPPVYWSDGTNPDKTVGVCLLLDIPLNLKYNFLNFSSSRFFATGGVSSYIMLNEDYEFRYDNDDAGLPQGWSDETGTRHWMSNANFSIGYELDIHPNWSLRAEPFIKIPIREVGWGNVRLYSMGSFISFNYNFSKTR